MIRYAPHLTIAVMLGPVLAGLWGTLLPAFGYLPVVGLTDPGLDAFKGLFATPGIETSMRLSVSTGLMATALSLVIVTLILAGWSGTGVFRVIQKLISPLLSVPHAAAAFGLAFLIAPSGWISRAMSPWATGWEHPPDILITQDPLGLSMTLGLVAKEVPFLMLMAMAALGQVQQDQRLRTVQALGYDRVSGWLKAVFPAVYAQIRLPVYVVLAYSMSVVDVALILGPTTPPPLSVQIVKWMSDPDLSMRMVAAAGSLAQLVLVILTLGAWRLGERLVGAMGAWWAEGGGRGRQDGVLAGLGLGAAIFSTMAVLGGLAGLAVWSLAGFWGFPDAMPQGLSMRSWLRFGPGAATALVPTMIVALSATGVALALVLGCLEAEHRSGRVMSRRAVWIVYLPLLLPQTAFLPGLQTFMLSIGAQVGVGPVIVAHTVFVLPYVFLSLGDPWRSWDRRTAVVAGALGATPNRVFWTVRLPMLLRPVLVASAVGLSVSVAQYLPTLLIGGGRVGTITTEAVALTSGGDRRAIGVFGLVQTTAALLPFALALLIPSLVWRNRRALHV